MSELLSTTIQKYAKYSTAQLKVKAQNVFNAWIRKRDEGEGCICCGSHNQIQAGHYYSAGHHNNLRFEEDNCHSECLRCNYFLSGNLTKYREGLIKKIGIERVERLDMLSKVDTTKNDRFHFIDVIENYKIKARR